MRDKGITMETRNMGLVDQRDSILESKVKTYENEIQRLRTMISKVANSMSWGNSVVKVVFRDESYSEKYKSKFETFLKELLDKDENFIINSQIYDDAEQEFSKEQHSFQAVTSSKPLKSNRQSSSTVPFIYSSEYEDVLHCDPEIQEPESNEKPPTVTCFNCLGDHHMKQCPEKIDRSRIAANKRDILMESSSRYHLEEKKNSLKPGNLSSTLREAMGLKNYQLPQYIYKMRVLGYPPGWKDEAVFETSGLSLYDSEGKAVSGNESPDLNENEKKYDSSQFVDYPGFNSPVPTGFKDEWKSLGLVPIQPEHQLSKTLKDENATNTKSISKRKSESICEEEVKKVRNGANESICEDEVKKVLNGPNDDNESNSNSSEQWNPENCSTPIKRESHLKNEHNGTLLEKSLGISLSKTPGTPILPQGNPFKKLPDADKFAQGITEHLPFENLPDSTGSFEKMRGILSHVQKKLHNMKNAS